LIIVDPMRDLDHDGEADGTPVTLPTEVGVVNVGLSLLADAVRAQGRPVVEVDWRIPGGGDPDTVAMLRRLSGPRAAAIDAANAEVVRRLDEGTALLVGVEAAGAAIPGLGERTVLHCGPAIAWEEMCDPLRRSVRAAVVVEGWAAEPADVGALVERGEVRLEPANRHAVVLPMATSIGPSSPLQMVENPQGGVRAFSPLNQGPGEAPWYGMDTPAAIRRLRLVRDVLGPVLADIVGRAGRVDISALAVQGLQMGDDVHVRTQATTNLLVRQLLPHLVEVGAPQRLEMARFLARNHLFVLNLAMAAARALTEWAAQVPGSSVVTSMARNGTTFGIRLAGRREWFLSPAPPIGHALYEPGYGPEDGAPDIGDSAVLELIGLGGAAAAGSPSVAAFLGGTMADALAATEAMDGICAGRSTRFRLPLAGFRGTPLGVDVRRVVEVGVTPQITTGILHATAGVGRIGAGVAEAPLGCFRDALAALDQQEQQRDTGPA
jgi:Protein of unknown function (DUF1116)